jgi:hypothetical protein
MKIVTLASLYKPLEFLENRIANLNQCDMKNTLVYWADCSPPGDWKQVSKIIKDKCKFPYKVHHFPKQTTLYYTWAWIARKAVVELGAEYLCNTNVDDIQHPEYFNLMSEYLDTNPMKQIVACKWQITRVKDQVWPARFHNCTAPNANISLGHFPMWRASVHKKVGYFNEKMVAIGDADFWLRIKYHFGGMKAIGVHDKFLSCYLQHKNNLYHNAKVGKMTGEGHDWAIITKQEHWKNRNNPPKKKKITPLKKKRPVLKKKKPVIKRKKKGK